ncbi:MAG: LPP20 family lipoprotein [Bacteroidales bacterium]
MKHKHLIYISLIILAGFASSCGIFKSTPKPSGPKPGWVESRPQSTMYYIGIGSAKKAGLSPNAYMSNAKNAALNALASDISVDISSSSVISTIETDYNLSETYERTITASSDKSIEGYETVDTWDSGLYYWVYVRLSKAQYEQQKAEKKNAAITKATDKLQQARNLKNEHNLYDAIHAYTEAFSDMSEYLAESTHTEIDGKQVDLGTTIYRELVETINNITLRSDKNPVQITSGKSIPFFLMQIYVEDNEGYPQPNLPFKLSFTGSGLANNKITSDQKGIIQIPLNKVYSVNQLETVKTELDMISISRMTKDIFIRTLIKKIPPPNYSLKLEIMSPKVFVSTSEHHFNAISNDETLKSALMNAMAKYNIRICDTKADADFIISIESNTEQAVTSSYQKTANLNYTITVHDENNRIVYRKDENKIQGFGNTYDEAGKEAYEEGANRIMRRNFDQIYQAVFTN